MSEFEEPGLLRMPSKFDDFRQKCYEGSCEKEHLNEKLLDEIVFD